MERILGIDPGSRTTGYGVIVSDRGRIGFIACGVIKASPQLPFAHRLNQIFDGVNEVIQLHGPTTAVVAAMQNGLQVYDYSPKLIKQGVAGYGQAGKAQVQHMVRVLLGLPSMPSTDAADALAVAICHANQFRL